MGSEAFVRPKREDNPTLNLPVNGGGNPFKKLNCYKNGKYDDSFPLFKGDWLKSKKGLEEKCFISRDNIMKEIIMQGRKIEVNTPPFIIAEMSGNHNQSVERALETVEAARGGAYEIHY